MKTSNHSAMKPLALAIILATGTAQPAYAVITAVTPPSSTLTATGAALPADGSNWIDPANEIELVRGKPQE